MSVSGGTTSTTTLPCSSPRRHFCSAKRLGPWQEGKDHGLSPTAPGRGCQVGNGGG